MRYSAAAGTGLAAVPVGHAMAARKEKGRQGFIGAGGRGIGHVARILRRPDVEGAAIL